MVCNSSICNMDNNYEGKVITIKLIRKDATATSLGCLSKAWYSDGKNEYLVKGNILFNDGSSGYEPFSEYIASVVAKHFNLPHIEYTIMKNTFKEVNTYNLDYVSVCKRYVPPKGYQMLSALEFMELALGKTVSSNYWEIYNKINQDIPSFLNMLVFDAMIGNEDRHLNNWDILIKGRENKLAPIFDNGASLLAYIKDKDLKQEFKIGPDKSKPFKDTHDKQTDLIKRRYPNYALCCTEQELSDRAQNILSEIKPVTDLLGFRGNCIRRYLYNRIMYYGTKFILGK